MERTSRRHETVAEKIHSGPYAMLTAGPGARMHRDPVDAFLARRRHSANEEDVGPDHPMRLPVSEGFRHFIDGEAPPNDLDRDTLAMLTTHYLETVCPNRLPGLRLFHYSDMLRDGRGTVVHLAEAAGIDAEASLIDKVAEATAFGAMKAKAADCTPHAGTGFWKSDANFFASASSRKWLGQIAEVGLDLYSHRLDELVPDRRARTWA